MQVDLHSFESILYSTPVLGRFLEHGFRALVTWQMLTGAVVLPKIGKALHKVPWLRQRWSKLQRWVWPPEGTGFEGRKLAPYYPAL